MESDKLLQEAFSLWELTCVWAALQLAKDKGGPEVSYGIEGSLKKIESALENY